MSKHLKLHLKLYVNELDGKTHPLEIMKNLGIEFQHATPQSLGDQWWFWNCTNIPSSLPSYLDKLNVNPMDCIGFGLSGKEANRISIYEKS